MMPSDENCSYSKKSLLFQNAQTSFYVFPSFQKSNFTSLQPLPPPPGVWTVFLLAFNFRHQLSALLPPLRRRR